MPGSLNYLFRDQWRGHCGLFKCCGVSWLGCQFLPHKQLMLGIQTTGKALRHPPSILDFGANDRMMCYVGTSEEQRRKLKRRWNLRHTIASSCPCTFVTLGLGLGGGSKFRREVALFTARKIWAAFCIPPPDKTSRWLVSRCRVLFRWKNQVRRCSILFWRGLAWRFTSVF